MSESPTLLIVDDSRVSRMMISSIVKNKFPDWQLLEAGNGEDAIEMATANAIDYFSIDLNMPGIDGLEVINQLKENYATSNMVLMTANIQDAVSDRAAKLGAACVHKPITEESINQMLDIFND